MTAILLQGHDAAREMLDAATREARALTATLKRAPCLGILCPPAGSAGAYLRRIEAFTAIAGIAIRQIAWPKDARAAVHALNNDPAVDGILPLAPFPAGLSAADLAEVLDPSKDVDGLTAANAGQLARGLNGLFPCTPQAALQLAERTVGAVRGWRATVVGASPSVGRPLAELLLQHGATVTVAHVDTRDLAAACRTAQILFVAVGKAGLIDASCVSPGATVIDIGINVVPDDAGRMSIVGDVDLTSVRPIAAAISSVPDGVGPLTTAFLIRNTLLAAARRSGASDGEG